LALKTRIVDACKIERGKLSFDAGITDFIDSGAVPLTRVPSPAEDNVQIYALWDSDALMIAIASDDQTHCTQDRANNAREEILRDDAVELVVAVDKDHVYRALFNLTGSTAYDRIGPDDWNPNEIYFRFDLDGPLPSNDCQEGQGYTFKVRIPWTDLGYLETPVVEKTFAFDLVLYDNDRGARSISAFSPMGPSEDLQALGELRLFEY
jgi:cellulose/xylan binding protein with CBM9 domain